MRDRACDTLPAHPAIRAIVRVIRRCFGRPARHLVAALAVIIPVTGASQEGARSTSLGIASAGLVAIHVAGARIERGAEGAEGGVTLDLGHFSSPRLRLVTDVAFLRTFAYEERVETEGKSYRDVFYDLSGNVAIAVHANPPTARATAYALLGVGVHALTSSFGSLTLDARYNSNNFGLLAGGGVRIRHGEGSRRAYLLELRRVQAHDVSRLSLHLGIAALFNDLARR